MAEYRGRMGMDRESRSSSLSILAENPSVEPCHCQPLPYLMGRALSILELQCVSELAGAVRLS